MTTKHTPGPWNLKENFRKKPALHLSWTIQTVDQVLAHVSGGHTGAEEDANARLIAAAPELLEACKELEMRLSLARISLAHMADQGGVDNMPVPLFLKKAREAIAKAEGKV